MRYDKNYNEAKQRISSSQKAALEAIGEQVVGQARKRAPVDTGELRDSLDYQVNGDVVTIGAGVEYATLIELGSSIQKAQPFLKSSAVGSIDEIEVKVSEEMSNI